MERGGLHRVPLRLRAAQRPPVGRFKLKVPAVDGDTDGERNLIIAIIFEQIEEMIDKAIAEDRTKSH